MENQMKMAADMMANMSPEQKAQMMNMMGNMDPSVMANMAKNMGMPAPSVSDVKRMQEQVQTNPNLLDDAAKAAQQPGLVNQMKNTANYYVNGAATLKAQGNGLFKDKKFKEAADIYSQAIENLENCPESTERSTLLKACRLNFAACCLETSEPMKAFGSCSDVILDYPNDIKARYRRGLAQEKLGKLNESVADFEIALTASPQDVAVKTALDRVLAARGESDGKIEDIEEPSSTSTSTASSSSTSSKTKPKAKGKVVEVDDEKPASKKKEPTKAAAKPTKKKNVSPEELMAQLTPAQVNKMRRLSMEITPLMEAAGIPPNTQPTPEQLRGHPELQQKIQDYNRQVAADPELFSKMSEFAASQQESDGNPMGAMAQDIYKDPAMMKSMQNMMGNMTPEQTQNMMKMQTDMNRQMAGGKSMEEAAALMKNDPNQMKMAMEMMNNMDSETTQSMMKMAAKMGPMMGGGGGNSAVTTPSSDSSTPTTGGMPPGMPDADAMAKMAEEMQKNPEMMKGMTDMMKNIDPDTLMNMSNSMPGMSKMSKEQAEQVSDQMKNISPESMQKLMKWSGRAQVAWGYAKQVKEFLFGSRIKAATTVVVVAVLLANWWDPIF